MLSRHRKSHWYPRLLIASFLLMILLPNVDMVVGLDKTPVSLQTAPAPEMPTDLLGLAELPGAFKWYFGENFGFRAYLIQLHGLYKTKVWGSSGSTRVLQGRQGWAYYLDDRTLEDYRNLYPFKQEEVDTWVQMIRERHGFCKARGIDWVFTIAPNKAGIYPEFLPRGWTPLDRDKRLNQLQSAVAKDLPEVKLIDLRPALLAAKDRQLLYYKTDTHWNEVGAFVGYTEVMKALKDKHPHLRVPSLDDIRVETSPSDGGDLARIMGLKFAVNEPLRHPVLTSTRTVRVLPGGGPVELAVKDIQRSGVPLITTCEEGEIDSAIIFHDSFGQAMIPFLARHFKRAVFVWLKGYERETGYVWSESFDADLLERERPTVVIQQLVERRLINWRPETAASPSSPGPE